MPIKWTSDNDQLLLIKILETHDLRVDTKKVAQAWPGDREQPTPRAISERLVKIRQINKLAGNRSLKIASSPSSGPATPKKPRSSPAAFTPGSGKRKKINGNEPMLPSPLKSEMGLDEDQDEGHEGDHESEGGPGIGVKTPSKKEKTRGLFDVPLFSADETPTSTSASTSVTTAGLVTGQNEVRAGSSLGLDVGSQSSADVVGDGSPVKPKRNQARARRATVQYDMVNYGDETGEESSRNGMDDPESSASDYIPDGAGLEDEDFA